MKTFQELYQDILEQEIGKGRKITGDYNPVHMVVCCIRNSDAAGDCGRKLCVLRG